MWCEVFAQVTILRMYKKDPARKKKGLSHVGMEGLR